jgi:hypothetical protein
MRIPYISALAAGALALGGCAYGDLGYGSGYYGGYGYGGPSFSVGLSSGYYSPYYGGHGYGYGYGSPFGWYDDFYYPGTGVYVYDTYRRPHVMTSRQRTYWSSRSPSSRNHNASSARANWSGFNHRDRTTPARSNRGRTR